MTNEPALVIFDCDGVLVDSERLTIAVEARLLTEMGWPITQAEIVERFMGRSDDLMLSEITKRLGQRAAEEFDRLCTDQVIAAFHDRLQPIDGVTDVITRLHEFGVASCVASSGSHRKMQLTLGITGLYEAFEGRIFSASEVANGKPAPDLFLHSAAEMAVEPTSAVVVEDSVSGVRAARAASMTCFGFSGGLTPPDRLREAGAIVFGHMDELFDLVLAPS